MQNTCKENFYTAYDLLDTSLTAHLPYPEFERRSQFINKLLEKRYGCSLQFAGSVKSLIKDQRFLVLRYRFSKEPQFGVIFNVTNDQSKLLSYTFVVDTPEMIRLPVLSLTGKEIVVNYFEEFQARGRSYLINTTSFTEHENNYLYTMKVINDSVDERNFQAQSKHFYEALKSSGRLDSVAFFAREESVKDESKDRFKLVYWNPVTGWFYDTILLIPQPDRLRQ